LSLKVRLVEDNEVGPVFLDEGEALDGKRNAVDDYFEVCEELVGLEL